MNKFSCFLLITMLLSSCLNNKNVHKVQANCICDFYLEASKTPNPDLIVFRVELGDTLRDKLLTEKWDSISFSGGIFDTLGFRNPRVGVSEIDSTKELLLAISTAKFSPFSQVQMDSIAFINYQKIIINIFMGKETWKLKPCEKSEIKQ